MKKKKERVDPEVMKYAMEKTPDVLKPALTRRMMNVDSPSNKIKALENIKKEPIKDKKDREIDYSSFSSPERAKEFRRLEKKKSKK